MVISGRDVAYFAIPGTGIAGGNLTLRPQLRERDKFKNAIAFAAKTAISSRKIMRPNGNVGSRSCVRFQLAACYNYTPSYREAKETEKGRAHRDTASRDKRNVKVCP
jgi:hypothetical protein